MSALARPGHAQQSHASTQLPKRKTGGAAFYRFFVFRVLFSRKKASNGRPSGRCQRLLSLRETKTREIRLEKTSSVKHLHWESWRSCQTAQQRHSSPFCSSTSDLGRQSTVTSGLPTTGCSSCHQSPHTTL